MASYKTHTVVRGDTLSHIALKYGTTVGYLAKLNNIRNVHRIYVGQVLKISEIVTVSPSKPNPTPAPAPQPSTPSNPAPVSNNTKVSLKSTTVTITAFGLQADTDRTFFATWDWDGPYTDRFEVRWFYRTENNVKFTGHSGSVSPTDNSQAQSTYNAPTNATHIYFQVKPIAQTHKVNNSDVAWWTANWSTEKVYNMSDLPPAKLSNPKVTLEDYTLKVEVTGVPEDVTGVEFQIIQNDTKVYMVGSSSNLTSTAKFSCSVDPGYDYKARCRAVKNGLYSEWTDYSSNVQTKPSKPDKINEIRALSGTSLTLNWSESTNAETYELEYATKLEYLGMSNASTTINGITGPRYIITGLGSGEKYFIRVRAANAQGKSDWTEAVSIILGSIPAAPTTWSSTTTAIVGEDMKLYWMHNSKDGSKETIAEIECIINNEAPTTVQVIKTNISDDVSYYNLITRTLTEGATIRWKVRTAGVTGEYGPWSATRIISIYAPPALALTIREDSAYGSVITEITRFPFYIVAGTGPASQKPLGYHLSVISRDSYETVDNLGNVKMVSAGQEIMSKFYDINEHTLTVKVTPGDIDLENNCRYYLQCTVTMDSGLTKEEKIAFKASFVETEYFPTAEILFNRNTLSTHIRPYCTEKHFDFYKVLVETKDELVSYKRTEIKIDPLEGVSVNNAITIEGDLVFVGANPEGEDIHFAVKESTREYLVENVTLSVYRQDYDGRFVTIATDIENLSSIYVTDPHPPLNYANYRIVVTDKITGGISYVDIPPYEIGVKSVIIQWGEKWENLTVLGQDPVEQVEWAGSMLKLPYNIDVSDSNTMDVSLVEYIGRAHPVSYYGTQLGVSSTWNVEIPKYDTSTLYGLRLLAIYAGDVYVREPSGSGYWANISVSFSQKHKDLTIPITLNIKRVDGDV